MTKLLYEPLNYVQEPGGGPGGKGGNRNGNPLEFLSLLSSLPKRW